MHSTFTHSSQALKAFSHNNDNRTIQTVWILTRLARASQILFAACSVHPDKNQQRKKSVLRNGRRAKFLAHSSSAPHALEWAWPNKTIITLSLMGTTWRQWGIKAYPGHGSVIKAGFATNENRGLVCKKELLATSFWRDKLAENGASAHQSETNLYFTCERTVCTSLNWADGKFRRRFLLSYLYIIIHNNELDWPYDRSVHRLVSGCDVCRCYGSHRECDFILETW